LRQISFGSPPALTRDVLRGYSGIPVPNYQIYRECCASRMQIK
jgi:hypothetical protein